MTELFEQRFLKARRSYIAKQFQNLNEMQREAALTTEGPLLLLAGAGSGKTTVLINRIANLIRFGSGSDSSEIPPHITEEDVIFLENLPPVMTDYDYIRADSLCALDPPRPWNIIAITFTNKAADELKERLERMLGEEARDIWAMTFHSACCRILRRDIERLGYTPRFTIYDRDDSLKLLKSIINDLGIHEDVLSPKDALWEISKYTSRQISVDDFSKFAEQSFHVKYQLLAKVYRSYIANLKENNALDFDSIIYLTIKLLKENPDLLDYYQRQFRYVLVDEYQDTNEIQYEFTKLIAGGKGNICVVGDDDQSIYRFRGANVMNILHFEKVYSAAKCIRLEQNYRSTQRILNAANSVISHNIHRKGKKLWTANGAGEAIRVYEALDEKDEAQFVVDQIKSNLKRGSLKDNAILYRTNAQANIIEQTLKKSRLPYRVFGGMRFYDKAEVKDVLAYLCVINNHNDDLRLNRIINNPPRGLGPKSLEEARRLALAEKVSLYDVISRPNDYAPLEKNSKKFYNFTSIIEELAELSSRLPLPEFYDAVLIKSGYVEMLKKKDNEENRTRLENVNEIKSSIVAYCENTTNPSLSGFLEEIALYTDIEEYDNKDDTVVMMTMHTSKGQEFPNVYLVGFEDGLFPGMRSIGDHEEMEEERRLCYVAITRAKQNLTISHARQRMLYGRTSSAMPSRFLKELPEDEIKKISNLEPRRPYSWGADGWGQYAQPAKPIRSELTGRPAATKPAGMLELNKGDMVEHTAFGRGMVLSVLKMSGDALLEIAFDSIGTKKLMAKTASAHMKKL